MFLITPEHFKVQKSKRIVKQKGVIIYKNSQHAFVLQTILLHFIFVGFWTFKSNIFSVRHAHTLRGSHFIYIFKDIFKIFKDNGHSKLLMPQLKSQITKCLNCNYIKMFIFVKITLTQRIELVQVQKTSKIVNHVRTEL